MENVEFQFHCQTFEEFMEQRGLKECFYLITAIHVMHYADTNIWMRYFDEILQEKGKILIFLAVSGKSQFIYVFIQFICDKYLLYLSAKTDLLPVILVLKTYKPGNVIVLVTLSCDHNGLIILVFIIHPCDPTVVICYLIWPCDIAVRITYLISHSYSLSYNTVIKGYFRLNV